MNRGSEGYKSRKLHMLQRAANEEKQDYLGKEKLCIDCTH